MNTLDRNQSFADRLGWSAADLGVSMANADSVIRTFQEEQKLTPVDCVMGPITYARWLDVRFREQLGTRPAGELAVNRAKRAWLDDVIDPTVGVVGAWPGPGGQETRSRLFIDRCIREALGWTWEPRYQHDGDYPWCGAFVAHCYAQVGLSLAVRYTFLSSTLRLDRLGRGLPHNGTLPPPGARLCVRMDADSAPLGPEDDDVQQGDILLVGDRGAGDHVTLVESYDGRGTFTTIEGNATGAGPRGNRREGVVRTTRPLGQSVRHHARRLIRFCAADFDAEAPTVALRGNAGSARDHGICDCVA